MTASTPAPDPVLRPYDKGRDLDAVRRIWHEIGWTTSDDDLAFVEPFYDAGRALVYEQDGAAESVSHIVRGTIRHQSQELVLAAVTAVATSRVARKRGAARRLLARMLAEEAQDGAHVAALGIFDQGFYDHLGFGTGPYDHRLSFDPATLRINVPPRTPSRVGPEDWEDVHACMLARLRGHGSITIDDPRFMKAELGWHEEHFGLGYRDGDGRLTHFVFGRAKGEHGPYHVTWIGYQDSDQLLELFALLKTLGDQVHEVGVIEPQHVQLQDLLREPFRTANRSRGDYHHRSVAWWQLRILDLSACLDAVQLPGEDLRFNLVLHDPAVAHLPAGVDWTGTSGEHVVTLGRTSGCEPGRDAHLPTLRAGVGAFSRLLFGVREASALAVTSDLDADPDLLAALDETVRLPPPRPGWDF